MFTYQLQQELIPFVRKLAQYENYADPDVMTLFAFLPITHLHQLKDSIQKQFQISSLFQQVKMMESLMSACFHLRIVIRRSKMMMLEDSIRLLESLMENCVCLSVLSQGPPSILCSLFLSYLYLQVKVQGRKLSIFFPKHTTVALLVDWRDESILAGLNRFVRKLDLYGVMSRRVRDALSESMSGEVMEKCVRFEEHVQACASQYRLNMYSVCSLTNPNSRGFRFWKRDWKL